MAALTTIALGAAVGLGAASVVSSVQAGKAQRNAARAEQRRAEIQNIRQVRQSIREARLAQGSIIAQGANAGTIGSSGVTGGVGSVSAQLGSNLNYLSSIAEENTNIFNASMKAAQYQSNAQIFGTLASVASAGYQGATGMTPGQAIGKKLAG